MGIFLEFGSWINQNIPQPLTEESRPRESGNVKPQHNINTDHEERDEMKEQLKLWRDSEKKKKWRNTPAKVKVEKRNDINGSYLMEIEFTLGLPPHAAYDVLTNPDNQPYFRILKGGRQLLENISRKVITSEKNGERLTVEAKKALAWNFLWWSGAIPITLTSVEAPNKLFVAYGKKEGTMKFMEMFEGSWAIEPIYVDSERLCKHMKPKSREEYRKCSGGQGKIASKVKMNQLFKPSLLLNFPPLSWYIRDITVKTTKDLIEDLQDRGSIIRGV